jgi:oxaloacetate decarboxylase gamma subunit
MSGVNLMITGMGIVFVFLLILVFAMKGMSRFAMFVNERHGVTENVSSQPLIKGQGQDGMRGDLVAVIAAAINSYRATHR